MYSQCSQADILNYHMAFGGLPSDLFGLVLFFYPAFIFSQLMVAHMPNALSFYFSQTAALPVRWIGLRESLVQSHKLAFISNAGL